MSGLFKLIKMLVVLSALVAGGAALWRQRAKAKQLWDSLGGSEGVVVSAHKLIESAGPVRDLVNQVSQLKK
ncbi:MAG: hypothetical protein A2133_01845 [Actinobacteria bacterium RBG_16_64_13]|nr:MAG: hypothetical protein A2133_01845 [Actinobacteria bacterium RBG_16_64_13]